MARDDGSKGQLWSSGAAYEPYVGRWSRLVAVEFLRWLEAPSGRDWLDVGCGTGALCEAIIAAHAPASVRGVDLSEAFIGYAREHVRDRRATFTIGSAEALPIAAGTCDAVVSGLALNFVPDPREAALEFARVLRPGGVAGACVWDYAGEMQMMRQFWDAAAALDAAAAELDEGRRCSICNPGSLSALLRDAGLQDVEARAIDVPTVFADFDDYWRPFLGGKAPAPAYAMSLSEERRGELRERIRARLPAQADGSIRLMARAWAVKGSAPR